MTTWRYQLMKKVHPTGEVWYGVHEYYEEEDGKDAWTLEPVRIVGESPEEIIEELKVILLDIQMYGVKDLHKDG